LTALTIVVPLPLILYAMFRKSMQHAEDRIAHLDKVNRLYHSTIEALAQAIDAKDQVTHGHIRRVQRYSARLAAAIGVTDENELKALEAASLLHDTGKLAIPEYILNKPDKLTKGEFERMKRHAAIGADILSSIEFPFPVVPIVRHHHENWNGSGYPDGLKETAIPLGARILSVIDCFDALTSDRPYRRKLSDSAALDILRERRGTMYDPAVVDAFVAAHAQGVFRDDVSESHAGDIITRASTEARIHDEHEAEPHEPPYFALFDFASAIAGASDPGPICDAVCEHFKTEFSVSSCVLFEYRDSTHELVASVASGAHATALRRLAIPLGERISGWVAANRSPIFNSDAALDLETLVLWLEDPPRRCLAVPLVTDGALVGVLTVYSKDDSAFGRKDVTVMTVVADRIAPMLKAAFAVRCLEDAVSDVPK
jgi:putative nucleotidyltransferase with HDIG domain